MTNNNFNFLEQDPKKLIIPIKLSDLINELCSITKNNIKSLDVFLTTNVLLSQISYNEPEDLTLEKLQHKLKSKLEIKISNNNLQEKSPINIQFELPLDISSKMANGELLFDNLGLLNKGNDFEIIVEKNIGNYICNFTLDQILSEIQLSSQPKGALKKAVINCYKSKKICMPHKQEDNLEKE